MEDILSRISGAIGQSLWFAPIFALVGGVLTSLMPCSLSTVPLVIGCVGGSDATGKRAFFLSLMFAVGSAITFVTLGVIASLAGLLLEKAEVWMHLILGLLLVLMALQMWGVVEPIPAKSLAAGNRFHGALGAFIAGMLAGVFSAHCATPMIVALLAIVADRGKALYGALLLVLFSIGHGVLAVIAGASVGLVQRITENAKYEKISKIIKICLGILIMLVAVYLLWEAFSDGVLSRSHEH